PGEETAGQDCDESHPLRVDRLLIRPLSGKPGRRRQQRTDRSKLKTPVGVDGASGHARRHQSRAWSPRQTNDTALRLRPPSTTQLPTPPSLTVVLAACSATVDGAGTRFRAPFFACR